MLSIGEMVRFYKNAGHSDRNADARVCQDIVLKAIEKSNLGKNVTIKGGVVMRSITGDDRRATEDIDLDFIRFSLDDDSIKRFISRLNCLDGIKVEIKGGTIEPLSQQEYRGKRVYVEISDMSGDAITSKIDIGVHANMAIEQEEYCFDVCMDDQGASLLINTCEQIFAEKLRSLLKFGPLSSRYKDIFDFCYLKDHVDNEKLSEYIRAYVIDDPSMFENSMEDVRYRVAKTFANRRFRTNIERASERNWLQMDVGEAFDAIEGFLKDLERYTK